MLQLMSVLLVTEMTDFEMPNNLTTNSTEGNFNPDDFLGVLLIVVIFTTMILWWVIGRTIEHCRHYCRYGLFRPSNPEMEHRARIDSSE